MHKDPYVIVQGGHVVLDYRTEVIDLNVLGDDPAVVTDASRVEGLLALLQQLRSEGEPVQSYLGAVEEWLTEFHELHEEFSTEELLAGREDG